MWPGSLDAWGREGTSSPNGAPHQDRHHLPAPFRIDEDVRERHKLLVGAAGPRRVDISGESRWPTTQAESRPVTAARRRHQGGPPRAPDGPPARPARSSPPGPGSAREKSMAPGARASFLKAVFSAVGPREIFDGGQQLRGSGGVRIMQWSTPSRRKEDSTATWRSPAALRRRAWESRATSTGTVSARLGRDAALAAFDDVALAAIPS